MTLDFDAIINIKKTYVLFLTVQENINERMRSGKSAEDRKLNIEVVYFD